MDISKQARQPTTAYICKVLVLVFNGGSSSLKAQLYRINGDRLPSAPPEPVWEARAGWVRRAGTADVCLRTGHGVQERTLSITSPREVLPPILESLRSGVGAVIRSSDDIAIAGHRIVHGGRRFSAPALITPEVYAEIDRLAEFAPEHHAFELQGIEAAQAFLPAGTPQIAVFDTAFHTTLPESAFVYPGPHEWIGEGIRRFGFHGISHRYISSRAAEILGRPLHELHMVTCHLGNGASLAAIREGQSVDTTMGFTPLEGLMMGTRSGTVDPGIVTYLIRRHGYSPSEMERLLNKESGLKGLSGVSADMREIVAAMEQGNTRAGLALDVFVHRLCRHIGGMMTSLSRLDALVFTGGIGENAAIVRERVCDRLAWLGTRIDVRQNAAGLKDCDVAKDDSPVRVLVVRTEEEWQIARECHRYVSGAR